MSLDAYEEIAVEGTDHKIGVTQHQGATYYRGSDIGNILGVQAIRNHVRNLRETETPRLSAPTNGGWQRVIYLSRNAVKHVVSKCRSPTVTLLAKHFGIEATDICSRPIESITLPQIMIAFAGEAMYRQYQVNGYRIDLYFPRVRLAVECDENYHRVKSQMEKDSVRQDTIQRALDCDFIRYSPEQDGFCVFALINEIYAKLRSVA